MPSSSIRSREHYGRGDYEHPSSEGCDAERGLVIDISIDIETFALGTNASIAQIGAAVSPVDTFFVVVDAPPGTFCPATIRWHAAQPGDTIGSVEDAVGLREALSRFDAWLLKKKVHNPGEGLLWTHATFDIPRLAEAYDRAGRDTPWHYRNCRDLRTLYDLAGGRPELPPVGTSHNALDDALYQLQEIQACRAAIVGR